MNDFERTTVFQPSIANGNPDPSYFSHLQVQLTESKLNETLTQYNTLKQEYENLQGGPHIRGITKVSELSKLSLGVLKNLHAQLRQDLEEIEKVLYRETASKCMVCEERNRTVTLNCNHFVLCAACALTQNECPYCQTPINLGGGAGGAI